MEQYSGYDAWKTSLPDFDGCRKCGQGTRYDLNKDELCWDCAQNELELDEES